MYYRYSMKQHPNTSRFQAGILSNYRYYKDAMQMRFNNSNISLPSKANMYASEMVRLFTFPSFSSLCRPSCLSLGARYWRCTGRCFIVNGLASTVNRCILNLFAI